MSSQGVSNDVNLFLNIYAKSSLFTVSLNGKSAVNRDLYSHKCSLNFHISFSGFVVFDRVFVVLDIFLSCSRGFCSYLLISWSLVHGYAIGIVDEIANIQFPVEQRYGVWGNASAMLVEIKIFRHLYRNCCFNGTA
jgi:hypothetical protein